MCEPDSLPSVAELDLWVTEHFPKRIYILGKKWQPLKEHRVSVSRVDMLTALVAVRSFAEKCTAHYHEHTDQFSRVIAPNWPYLVDEYTKVVSCLDARIRGDANFTAKSIKYLLECLDDFYDPDLWEDLVKLVISQAPAEMMESAEAVLTLVLAAGATSCQGCKYVLKDASSEVQANRAVVMAAVNAEGDALEFASDDLKSDRELVMAAVVNCGYALHYAAPEMLADREIVLTAARSYQSNVLDLDPDFEDDREIVLAVVTSDASELMCLDADLQADREVVLTASASSCRGGLALDYAAASLRADRDVVLTCVTNYGSALSYADAFQADRGVVLAAVKECGPALEYASAELQADSEVVLVAMTSPSKGRESVYTKSGWPYWKYINTPVNAEFVKKHGLKYAKHQFDPAVARMYTAMCTPAEKCTIVALRRKKGIVGSMALKLLLREWAPCRHDLFHTAVQRAVHTTLLVSLRLDNEASAALEEAGIAAEGVLMAAERSIAAEVDMLAESDQQGEGNVALEDAIAHSNPKQTALPRLPTEIWLYMMRFYLRTDWNMGHNEEQNELLEVKKEQHRRLADLAAARAAAKGDTNDDDVEENWRKICSGEGAGRV